MYLFTITKICDHCKHEWELWRQAIRDLDYGWSFTTLVRLEDFIVCPHCHETSNTRFEWKVVCTP